MLGSCLRITDRFVGLRLMSRLCIDCLDIPKKNYAALTITFGGFVALPRTNAVMRRCTC